jgi:hypothetical protein
LKTSWRNRPRPLLSYPKTVESCQTTAFAMRGFFGRRCPSDAAESLGSVLKCEVCSFVGRQTGPKTDKGRLRRKDHHAHRILGPLTSRMWAILSRVLLARPAGPCGLGDTGYRWRGLLKRNYRYTAMPQTSRQGRSALLLASLCLASGMLASPALAGGHKHV